MNLDIERLKDAYIILGDAVTSADWHEGAAEAWSKSSVQQLRDAVAPTAHPAVTKLAEAETLISQSLAALGREDTISVRLRGATDAVDVREAAANGRQALAVELAALGEEVPDDMPEGMDRPRSKMHQYLIRYWYVPVFLLLVCLRFFLRGD